MKNVGRYVVALVAMLLAVASAVYFGYNIAPTDGAIEVPGTIGEFELVSAVKGREALESIRGLHVGSVEDIEDSAVAVYMNPSSRRLHLWVASFISEEDAEANIGRMVDAMQRQPEFGYTPKNHSLNGVKVYANLGEGKVDVFWAEENRLFYLLISEVSLEDSFSITREFMSEYRAQS
ncbi:MAG: hypothetical protein ACE5KU_00135 [Nitrososphaerales archaeon]